MTLPPSTHSTALRDTRPLSQYAQQSEGSHFQVIRVNQEVGTVRASIVEFPRREEGHVLRLAFEALDASLTTTNPRHTHRQF
jgi:hypothetical protein